MTGGALSQLNGEIGIGGELALARISSVLDMRQVSGRGSGAGTRTRGRRRGEEQAFTHAQEIPTF